MRLLYKPVLALAAVLLAAACGGGEGTRPGQTAATGPKLVKPGKIVTCTNIPYAPFQFKQGGKIVGFDVDMIDLVAKKLNVTQEIVDIDFAVIKSGAALNAGKCDVAAAGMTITDKRVKNLDFSVPYFSATQALLAKKGLGVASLEDVKAKGVRFGAQAATTGLAHSQKQGLNPKAFADSGKEINALQAGQVDVIIQDYPVVREWLKKPEIAAKFELAAKLDTGEVYGFAVKKGGDPELLKTINTCIEQAKKDGTWAQLHQKWFGEAPTATPGPSFTPFPES